MPSALVCAPSPASICNCFMCLPHRYSDAELAAAYRVIAERCILHAAHQAPGVGLMQPWRFIRISNPELREQVHALVEAELILTAQALGEQASEFLRLKVEGVRDCAELWVAALMDQREPHVFGRRTLPEMDLASVACAIQNLWLTARAEGLGMGWVSLFDPDALATLLNIPAGGKPVAILCLGQVEGFYHAPMLQLEGWRMPQPLNEVLFENRWGCQELECCR